MSASAIGFFSSLLGQVNGASRSSGTRKTQFVTARAQGGAGTMGRACRPLCHLQVGFASREDEDRATRNVDHRCRSAPRQPVISHSPLCPWLLSRSDWLPSRSEFRSPGQSDGAVGGLGPSKSSMEIATRRTASAADAVCGQRPRLDTTHRAAARHAQNIISKKLSGLRLATACYS